MWAKDWLVHLLYRAKGFKMLVLGAILLLATPICRAQNDLYYEGFQSIGLTDKATPVDVYNALPVGATWHAYVENCQSGLWTGYHKFTGSLFAVKTHKDKCLFFRIEDNYDNNGWNDYMSSCSLYMAQYSRCQGNSVGYKFTGFEPVNGKSQSKMRNDGVAAMELVRVCESYIGKLWQYDDKQHLDIINHLKRGDLSVPKGFYTQDDVKQYKENYRTGIFENKDFPVIDCVTLIKMAIAGIPYEYSVYADKSYLYKQLNAYPWSMQPTSVWLYELMEWCITSGYEIAPGPNFENLQAGDLIFYTSDVLTKRDAQPRKVCHVAMFTGRWVADKGERPFGVSGKVYPIRYRFPIYDDKGKFLYNDTVTLHPQTVEVTGRFVDNEPNTYVVGHSYLDYRNKSYDRSAQIVMYARLPLNTHGCWNNRNKWDNPANMIHVSGFDTDYRIDLVGDGKPLTLYIGSLNQSGNLSGVGENVATDYMPYSPDAYETIPEGAKLTKEEYYDELLRITKSRTSAKYIRKFFSNTTLEDMQKGYMYNGVNQYKVWNEQESPIIISGTLKKGETAIFNTMTGRIYTSEGSVLTYHKGGTSNPGMKVVYCPTGQEAMVTWEN